MSEKTKTNLSNLELQVTQKIQLMFPRGEIDSEILKFWDSCPSEFLKAQIFKAFAEMPIVINVDRSVPPVYPDWVVEVIYKEWELVGPDKFIIEQVKQWQYPEQVALVSGDVAHQYLKSHDLIKNQLGLAELLAIQAMGVVFFKKHFFGKKVFGWKSVVLDGHHSRKDLLRVPCLSQLHDNGVYLDWEWVNDIMLNSHKSALHF